MSQSLTSKLLSWLAALLSGVGLIFLTLAVRRSRLPYNSEGNYFDGVVNYHEHSVVGYGVMAGVSFLAAIMLYGTRLLMQRARQGVQADRAASKLDSK
jgi:hypothetical protein